MKRFHLRTNPGVSLRAILALALLSVSALHGPEARAGAPTYSIDFYVIGAGGHLLRGSCFRLSATIGQTAPGYSSAAIYSLLAGYWANPHTVDSDEIFYNGFEDCSS